MLARAWGVGRGGVVVCALSLSLLQHTTSLSRSSGRTRFYCGEPRARASARSTPLLAVRVYVSRVSPYTQFSRAIAKRSPLALARTLGSAISIHRCVLSLLAERVQHRVSMCTWGDR